MIIFSSQTIVIQRISQCIYFFVYSGLGLVNAPIQIYQPVSDHI